MPGKARHSRQSKKRKHRLDSSAIAIQKTEAAQSREPVIPAKTSTPSASVPISVSTIQVPYVVNELRRIGILSGVILVILIVLALVFS